VTVFHPQGVNMTKQDDLELGLWQLERRALDGDLGAQAVLDEVARLRIPVPDEVTASRMDSEATPYAMRYLYETMHDQPAPMEE
jgi:hypothetical protein